MRIDNKIYRIYYTGRGKNRTMSIIHLTLKYNRKNIETIDKYDGIDRAGELILFRWGDKQLVTKIEKIDMFISSYNTIKALEDVRTVHNISLRVLKQKAKNTVIYVGNEKKDTKIYVKDENGEYHYDDGKTNKFLLINSTK